jgi:hypothetical protein
MPEMAGRQATRLDPTNAWTVVTDAPLKGLAFAREAGTILAWDEGNQLYLFNIQGESLSSSRVPNKIEAGAISDEGSLIALLCEADEAGLLLLSADFDIQSERPAPTEATLVTIDPHGRYVAVGTRFNTLHFINRYGKPAGRLDTMEPMSHLCFVPGLPLMVGAAAFGMLVGISLEGTGSQGRLDPEIVWQDRLMSNVGRLALNGDGSMILASCFTLGIQRFDLQGRNEGSYHLGGTVSHAVPDFPGRTIVASSLEGELVVMNSAGNVRWRTQLPRPVIALDVDPLGRYVIYGHASGEIVRLDLFGGTEGRPAAHAVRRAPKEATTAAAGGAVRTSSGPVRPPDWQVPVVETDQQSETAVVSVVDDPPLIAVFTSPHRLQLLSESGHKVAQGPDMMGVGRILRTAPGWLAAATDRQIVLCDLRQNQHRVLDVSLVQLTHLAISPDDFGLALVQERDRIGRLTTASRWVWKHELSSAIEDLALGPQCFAAVTTTGGQLLVFDPAGEILIGFGFDATDPPLLIQAPDGSPENVAWLSLARRSQWLRAHGFRGEVVWDRPLPWEGWTLHRLGPLALVAAADGRALACDGAGAFHGQGAKSGDANDAFSIDRAGQPVRISRKDIHVICSALDGHVLWRSVLDQTGGPIATGTPGTAVMVGKSLAWFKTALNRPSESTSPR